MQALKIQFKVAHFRDFMGIFQRFREIPVGLCHFRRSFQIKEITLHFHPFLVVYRRVGADAQKQVVSGCILAIQIMGVIGGHHGNTGLAADLNKACVDLLQFGNRMALDFQIEFAEFFFIPERSFFCIFHTAGKNLLRDFPGQTGRKRD